MQELTAYVEGVGFDAGMPKIEIECVNQDLEMWADIFQKCFIATGGVGTSFLDYLHGDILLRLSQELAERSDYIDFDVFANTAKEMVNDCTSGEELRRLSVFLEKCVKLYEELKTLKNKQNGSEN